MPLTIYKDDHPILKKKAVKIDNITPALRLLAANMMATMHLKSGVGLAAPQVGESIQLIVFDVVAETMNSMDSGFLFNPEIIEKDGKTLEKEGCLSYPGLWVPIERSEKIKVQFMDISGRKRVETYKGIAARVIQHEIDHLNGVTIKDYDEKK